MSDIAIGDNDIVFIKLTLTLSISAQGYVKSRSISAYELVSDTSVPSDSTTHSYKQIAAYSSGLKTGQYVNNFLTQNVKDDGTGTSTPNYIWGGG